MATFAFARPCLWLHIILVYLSQLQTSASFQPLFLLRSIPATRLTFPVSRNAHSSRSSSSDEDQKAIAVSSSILNSLRNRTQPSLLNLATDFYDPSTGLHSEGIWHNCMVGIASLRLNENENLAASKKIADSLWHYSWDGTSFQRRTRSGLWDHSDEAFQGLEQPDYYQSSKEHRCVQHGIALAFWSLLVSSSEAEDGDADTNNNNDRYRQIKESFLEQFWDEDISRWRSVSEKQGGGTVLRPAASSNRVTGKVSENGEIAYYYRAVDQAVAVLACLGVLDHASKTQEGKGRDEETSRIEAIIKRTCQELLSEHGFAFGSDAAARSYIGFDRNRNFWHDGWVMLALIGARKYVWSEDPKNGEDELRSLLQGLMERYGHLSIRTYEQEFDGTVWHWSRSLKPDETSGNVQYCGDNALLYALVQNLHWTPGGIGTDEYTSSFWKFVSTLQANDEEGLVSVADVYKQVRLHPNTELAALLLWKFP